MELLDNEEKQLNPSGQMLGYVGGILYTVAGLACALNVYTSLVLLSSVIRTGRPDDSFMSKNMGIEVYAILLADVALIFALICQRRAFFKFKYSPMWLWWVILLSSISALFSWVWPTNPMAAIVAMANFYHLYKRRKVYRDFEKD